MIKKRYPLKSHHIEEHETNIYVSIEIEENKIKIKYEIIGDLLSYNFPKVTKQKRANELWRDTCFELFIANYSSEEYYEINTSPSTEWNAYHFTSYKNEMKASDVFSVPNISFYQLDKRYEFSFEMTFRKDIFEKELLVNLAVILLDQKGIRHFYTIHRQNKSPNFHDREWHTLISH